MPGIGESILRVRPQCLTLSSVHNTILASTSLLVGPEITGGYFLHQKQDRSQTHHTERKKADCGPLVDVGQLRGGPQRSTMRNRGRDPRVPGGGSVGAQSMLPDVQSPTSFCETDNPSAASHSWLGKKLPLGRTRDPVRKPRRLSPIVGCSKMRSDLLHPAAHDKPRGGTSTLQIFCRSFRNSRR